MKTLKTVFVILIGLLLTVSIYRGLTLEKLEKLDSLLIVAFSILILIVSFIERTEKRHKV